MDREVVLASWGAVFGDLDEAALVAAAFNDIDLVTSTHTIIDNLNLNIPKRERVLLGQHALMATAAVERAWERANLSEHRNLLRGKGVRQRNPRAAVVAGTSIGMLAPISDAATNPALKISPYTLSGLRGNSIAAPIAIRFGLGAGDLSVSSASATGGQAIWLGANLIRTGAADLVVVVCADLVPPGFTRVALQAVGATSKSLESRPLSSERDGMRPVEAAAALVLESYEHAKQREHPPLASWVNGAIRNDCHHLVAPEPSAMALQEAVEETLNQVGYDAVTIEWLSLHATGTRVWGPIEAQLVAKIFAHQTPHVSAFKRTFGHTLGAAGLLEVAMIAEGLSTQRLPVWPQQIDPALMLVLPRKPRQTATRAMTWSAGMGGGVAVNLFEKWGA